MNMPLGGPVEVFWDKCEAVCGLQRILGFQVSTAYGSGAQQMQTL